MATIANVGNTKLEQIILYAGGDIGVSPRPFIDPNKSNCYVALLSFPSHAKPTEYARTTVEHEGLRVFASRAGLTALAEAGHELPILSSCGATNG